MGLTKANKKTLVFQRPLRNTGAFLLKGDAFNEKRFTLNKYKIFI